MEMISACLCCMVRPPDKDLSTPYPRLGSTEIYSDMLEYCFQIQLTAGTEEGGICEDCVGQLRDVRDFRLQVECSQARLQAQLRPWPPLEDEAAGCFPETYPEEANDGTQSNEQTPIVIEIETDSEDESYAHGETSHEEPPVKVEDETDSGDEPGEELLSPATPASDTAGDTVGAADDTADTAGARARQQLAMSCRVRLTRLGPRAAPDSAVAETRPPTPRRSSERHEDRPYFCFLCNKQFTEISDLVAHMDTHTGQKPFSCQVCYKSFAIESHLMLHTKNHSRNHQIVTAEYYQCAICKNKYTNKKCFTEHTRKHMGQKRHSCEVCGKIFLCNSHLIEHKRVHTGERPFPCKQCNKRFKTNRYLEVHMRVHTGIKPYGCDICRKLFTFRSNLVVHNRRAHAVQKPYTGKACNKKIDHNTHVTLHNMTHTGFKTTYICKTCKMQFVKKSEFIKHKRTHAV